METDRSPTTNGYNESQQHASSVQKTLGVLTHSVVEVLHSPEILSLEVIRMPKSWKSSVVRPEDIPELSVLTTSTHDMHNLRYWWKER